MIPRRTMQNMKGFQAQANVPFNSPTQTNNQNVNVIVTDSSLTKDKAFSILNTKDYQEKELPAVDKMFELKGPETGLNDNLDKPIEIQETPLPIKPVVKERTIETAKESLEEFRTMIKEQNSLIEALSLILDIYERNPLIINKCIIAEEEELSRLLFLLTNAEQIEMVKTDPETGCMCKPGKFTYINKIMIRKNGNTYNFKYSFPNVIQLLENRHISYKICI